MQLKNLSHIITSLPPSYSKSEIDLYIPTAFEKENLYYLRLAYSTRVQFPFYLECKPFDSYLILYTLDGEGVLSYNDMIYTLKPNSIIFINCNLPFRFDLSGSCHWIFNVFLINGSSTMAYFETYHQNDYLVCNLSPLSHLPQILEKLLQTSLHEQTNHPFITSKLIVDLLTELILAKEADIHHTENFPRYLVQIKALFDSNYKEHFNLDNLAQTYQISKYKIIRDFTTYLHKSPINYLIDKRISVAKHLLLETDYPIYEIASMVGIENINHFTNLFKKSTGLTPNHYRKTVQIERTEFLDD